jgi:hypothetical protein
MERLVEIYRLSSSVWAVASLVIANLVPLVGALFFGWDLWTIIALYWAENGIIGLYTVAKILRAEGTSPVVGRLRRAGLSPAQQGALGAASRAATAAFFMVHYGFFWFVHGIFVLVALPSFAGIRGAPGVPDPGDAPGLDPGFGVPGGDLVGVRADMDLVILGAAALAVSHGVAFVIDFLGRKEYRRTSPQAQAGAPYGRLVVLHMTIILGAFLSAAIGQPVGALLVLVALKTAMDLALHLREHRALADGAGQSAAAGTGTGTGAAQGDDAVTSGAPPAIGRP